MTLAGDQGRTLLAECQGALLQFFDTPQACALRLVCREFQAAVAAYPWEDRETVIKGSIGGWRACFPWARCANVRYDEEDQGWRHTPVVDADFVHFVGLWELSMVCCEEVTDAAFVHLRGIRVLDMSLCSQPSITDAGLAHLVGIQKLCIWGCDQTTLTDAAFAPLGGIRVLNMSACTQLTDAAFAHLKGIHTLFMWWCDQPSITDAALAHIKGIKCRRQYGRTGNSVSPGRQTQRFGSQPTMGSTLLSWYYHLARPHKIQDTRYKCLVLHWCSIPFTEVGLTHLKGITRLHMEDANAASIAAARDLGLPATTGVLTEISAFRFSDAESGPWPAGAEWV